MPLFLMLSTLLSNFLNSVGELITSKKVITGVTTVLVAWAAKRGYNLDPQYIAMIMGLGAVLIHAQGNADHGKEAAKIIAGKTVQKIVSDSTSGGSVQTITTEPVAPNPAATPPVSSPAAATSASKGFVSVGLLGLLASTALIAVALLLVVGCGSTLSGKGAATDALNCLAPAAKAAITTYGPSTDAVIQAATEGNGSLLTDKLDDAFKNFATDEAKCVAMDSLAKLLTPKPVDPNAAKSSAQVVPPDVARATFESYRAKLAGGRQVRLESGAL